MPSNCSEMALELFYWRWETARLLLWFGTAIKRDNINLILSLLLLLFFAVFIINLSCVHSSAFVQVGCTFHEILIII